MLYTHIKGILRLLIMHHVRVERFLAQEESKIDFAKTICSSAKADKMLLSIV